MVFISISVVFLNLIHTPCFFINLLTAVYVNWIHIVEPWYRLLTYYTVSLYDLCQGHFVFNNITNDLHSFTQFSNHLLLDDDIKKLGTRILYDSSSLPADIRFIVGWCIVNQCTWIYTCVFAGKSSSHSSNNTDIIKDTGIILHSKLHFHHCMDYLFFHVLKLLGLNRAITFSTLSTDSLFVLYFTPVTSKLEHFPLNWIF
jgi:hypothetical protein